MNNGFTEDELPDVAAPELLAPARYYAAEEPMMRQLPHAVGPEKGLLSIMLRDPQEYVPRAIEENLSEVDFYLPAHSTLYGAILELFSEGKEIEIVSLVQYLLDRGRLDRCGGPATIVDIMTYSASPQPWGQYMELVRDKAILRRLIEIANETITDAYDAPGEARELLDRTESNLAIIRAENDLAKTRTVKEAINWTLDDLARRIDGTGQAGLATGFPALDRLAGGGLKAGELFVIAARPSMGKTSLMMNMVEHVCLDGGLPTMVFSTEMTTNQLVQRLVYSRSKFNLASLAQGSKPDKGTLQRLQRQAVEVAKAKLFIDDTSGISINQIRAKARRRHREQGLQLIAIDYLQLLRSTSKQAAGSREREIAEISAGIKGLAKELCIPIIILAQLNRDADKRSGKSLGVPRLSDLRESGAIEQDADLVGLLYRSAYYADTEEDKTKEAGRATLNLAKNRNGETGIVNLTWIAELMRFEDGAPAETDMHHVETEQGRFGY